MSFGILFFVNKKFGVLPIFTDKVDSILEAY